MSISMKNMEIKDFKEISDRVSSQVEEVDTVINKEFEEQVNN